MTKPTQEQVIAWAREAGVIECDCCLPFWPEEDQPNWEIFFERLATLAYEAGRESMKWDGIHTCHDQCQRPACVARRNAYKEGYEAGRKDENEACAKVCDEMAAKDKLSNYYLVAANAIRARREQ